jgi:hypothetical protein
VWQTNNVKGRILFHFARRNNARDDVAAVTAENYLYRAMHENRIRTLYHIIPEQSWQEVAATLAKRPLALREGNGFRLVIEGMPVHVMRIGDLRDVGEPVLVNIETKWWGEKEIAAIEDLLRRRVFPTDIVTISASTGEQG